MVDPYERQTDVARAYIRATYGRTTMYALKRATMTDAEPYTTAIPNIVRQHLVATDREYAQRQLAIQAVKVASAVRVLASTKGVPKWVGSARLAAHMRANRGDAAGYKFEKDEGEAPDGASFPI